MSAQIHRLAAIVCRIAGRPLALLAALALIAAGSASAFFRHPTSDDFLSPADKTCTSPAPSPDGRTVAYVVENSGLKQIWVRALGRPPVDRKLSDGQSNDDSPDWSPDGTRIYFSSDRGGTSKIWVMDVGRGTRRPITTGTSQDFHPRVSPSGRLLAYDSNREGNYDIWSRDLVIGADRRLTAHPAGDFSPCWSPREDEVAFTSSRGGQFNIWIQDAAAKNPARQLTYGKGGSAHPDWSPDGRAIAYDSDREGGTKVYVQPVGGATPLAVTDLLSTEERPRYMRHGKRIFFSAKENQLSGFKAKAAPVIQPGGPRVPAMASLPLPEPGAPPALQKPRFRGNRLAIGKSGGLTVLQFFPATLPGGVRPDATIGAVFNKPLDEGQDLKGQVRIWESTAEMSLDASYNPSLRRLEIMPDFPLRPETTYKVVLSKELRAAGGETLGQAFAWSFQTSPKQVAQAPTAVMHVGRLNRSFSISTKTPKERSGGVQPGSKIQVGFSLPVDPKSLDVNSLRLYTAAGQSVPGELFFPPGDYTLELTPYEPLQPGTIYEARASSQLKSQEGDALTGSLAWRFRTAYSGPLRVLTVHPDRVVGEHPIILLKFNRPLASKTVGSGKVVLQGKDFPYPGAVTLTSGNQILTFEPYQKLPDKQQLVLYLPVGLTDADGNGLELSGPITFTTDHASASRQRQIAAPKQRAPVNMAKSSKPAPAPAQAVFDRYLKGPEAQIDQAPDWVVRDLQTLASKGHLSRDFESSVQGTDGHLSRYKSAIYVEQALRAYPYMKPREREQVKRLASALGPELASLGVRMDRAIARGPAVTPSPRKPGPAPADADRSG